MTVSFSLQLVGNVQWPSDELLIHLRQICVGVWRQIDQFCHMFEWLCARCAHISLYVCITRDSKLTMLLRESLGNMNCRTTMIAHISASPRDFSETLSTVQIASRVLRMKKKKTKVTVVSLNQTLMLLKHRGVISLHDTELKLPLHEVKR